jgi:hypothetical protein
VLARALIAAAAALAAVPATAVAGSTIVRSERVGPVELSGVGCGGAGSAAVPLPATATAITARHPRAGDTTPESRLTAVTVAGRSLQLTAVGAGPFICDPEEDPDVPPAQRPWTADYVYDVTFRERVAVAFWAGAQVRRAKPRVRPRTILVPDIARMVHVRWKRFGGRSAIGSGRLRCEIPGCVGRGDRFRIVLDRPSRCGDVGDRVYYGRIRFYATRTYHLLYPIRRGSLYSGGVPQCGSTAVTRV